MTAKEFLQQAYLAHGEVEIKLEKIKRLQELATKTTSTIRSTPSGDNVSISKLEKSVVAIQEQIERLAEEVKNLLAINKEIETAINHVENPLQRKILEYRYLCFFSWQQISILMKTSLRYIYKIHNLALKNFSVPCS